MNNKEFDIAIVGGGIVGLSSAYKLQLEFPELKIVVLEKEDELASHQSGRNSGVIHSGLYYKPESFKARNCVEGRKQLLDFAIQNQIAHDICGKIVLATNSFEASQLPRLKKNGEKNGLKGIEIIDKKQIKEIEPYADGISALWIPETGIIDYKAVTNKFAEKIVSINSKSKIEKNCEVLDVSDELLFSTKGKIKAKNIIFCVGLFSDRLAKKDNLDLSIRIVGFRGDYFKINNEAKHTVSNLIYPVPNPEFPFLGVHFTRMVDGSVECGPNAVFTFKREGYKKTDFSLNDTFDALSFLGTWRLFINHWKFGLNEYRRAFSKRLFLNELKKMIPTLKLNDITECGSGVRAMALNKNGEIIDDFCIVQNNKNIHVLNAPSPAATACMSIGDHVKDFAIENFKLK